MSALYSGLLYSCIGFGIAGLIKEVYDLRQNSIKGFEQYFIKELDGFDYNTRKSLIHKCKNSNCPLNSDYNPRLSGYKCELPKCDYTIINNDKTNITNIAYHRALKYIEEDPMESYR